MIPQHSAKSVEWGTPADIVESARVVLGSFDLDPASTEAANLSVKATRFFTKEDDGLNQRWGSADQPVTVFLNPPGDGLAAQFWFKLMGELASGSISHAFFVGFTIEILRTGQSKDEFELSPLHFPLCVPRRRLKFVPLDGQKASSPAHSNVLIYVPGLIDNTEGFNQEFSKYGDIG